MKKHDHTKKQSIVVLGLVYGDEGKGTITDFLVRTHHINTVVRFNGGSQAAHHVVEAKNRWHCFSQFGSGTLAGAKTYLSATMLIDPLALEKEARVLQRKHISSPMQRLMMDENCLLITPYHRYLNQLQELCRAEKRHGSCGQGIGQVMKDSFNPLIPSLRVIDLYDKKKCLHKLNILAAMKMDLARQYLTDNTKQQQVYAKLCQNNQPQVLLAEYDRILFHSGIKILNKHTARQYLQQHVVLYEGAQGILLDMDVGFFPHVTYSKTTNFNLTTLIPNSNTHIRKIACLRAYFTRHGSGPLVTEDKMLAKKLTDLRNTTNPWQGKMRYGWLDLVALRYALKQQVIDEIALTCLDQLTGLTHIKIAIAYSHPNIAKNKHYFHWRKINHQIVIDDIRTINGNNLKTRKKLTKLLSQCTPIYQTFSVWQSHKNITTEPNFQTLKTFLQSNLQQKINIISAGETYKDKQMIDV